MCTIMLEILHEKIVNESIKKKNTALNRNNFCTGNTSTVEALLKFLFIFLILINLINGLISAFNILIYHLIDGFLSAY